MSRMKLEVNFRMEPHDTNLNIPGSYGSAWFDDGDAIQEAAAWCKIRLDEFLYRAITDHLAEVQAAMARSTSWR